MLKENTGLISEPRILFLPKIMDSTLNPKIRYGRLCQKPVFSFAQCLDYLFNTDNSS